MFRWLYGRRPDLTPAQMVAAIPVLILLLWVLGAFDLSRDEQHGLIKAVEWGFVLIGADAVIRVGRNVASRGRLESPYDVEGGDLLLRPPTEEELAEAERLEQLAEETHTQAGQH
jgi:hypothetical protein